MRRTWSALATRFRDDPLLPARLALTAGLVAGVLTGGFFLLLRPDPNVSFDIYYHAAETALAGDIEFDTPSGAFVYPPAVSLAFAPLVLLFDLPTAFWVYRLLNVLVALTLGLITADFIEDHRGGMRRLDRALVVAFFVGTVYPLVTLVMGQVSILVGAGLVVGVVSLERRRPVRAGASFALVASVKVFPALWGVWFLRERAWRAIGAAVAVGVGSLVVGLAVFGVETYLRYLSFVRANRVRIGDFAGPVSPHREFLSLMRPLSSLLPGVDPVVYPAVALLVVSPVVLRLYRRVRTLEGRLVAVLATVIGVIVVLPTSQDLNAYHVYFPAVAAAYLVDRPRVRWLVAAGLVVVSFNFDPEEVDAVLAVLASDPVRSAVMSAVTPVLTFASMPLYGLSLMFLGCAVYGYRLPGPGPADPSTPKSIRRRR